MGRLQRPLPPCVVFGLFVWVQEEEDAALAAHVGGVDAAAHTGKCEDPLRMCRLVCLRVCPAACASMRECW